MNAVKPPILEMGGLSNAGKQHLLWTDWRLTGKPVSLFSFVYLHIDSIPFLRPGSFFLE
jgi:hypothetical protein